MPGKKTKTKWNDPELRPHYLSFHNKGFDRFYVGVKDGIVGAAKSLRIDLHQDEVS